MDGDSSLLFDAIGNLVDNAIKFTPTGGKAIVAITVHTEDLALGVTDTGDGIDPW